MIVYTACSRRATASSRPAEVDLLIADPTKAREQLGWEPGGLSLPVRQGEDRLVNYVEALHYLDELAERGGVEITPETILALHKRTTRGLGSEESAHFKPRHEGAWRDGIARAFSAAAGRLRCGAERLSA